MYIKFLEFHNLGPIEDCVIHPSFFENGNPKPLIIIGSNGSGKTYVTSYICDAFIELARKFYSNAVVTPDAYYRYISDENITNGKNFGYSIINFFDQSQTCFYIEKSGIVPNEWVDNHLDEFTEDEKIFISGNLLTEDKYIKEVIVPGPKSLKHNFAKFSKNIFENNVICYFPSDRTEKPQWFNEHSVKTDAQVRENAYIPIDKIDYSHLRNPVIIDSSTQENINWMNNILNMCSILTKPTKNDEQYLSVDDINEAQVSGVYMDIKSYITKIIALILNCHEVTFHKVDDSMTIRYDFKLFKNAGDSKEYKIINASQLSLGESVLFNSFISILRCAEQNGLLKDGTDISEISGIVVIDEIDVHLDNNLQYNVLPKLLALFPKIQFIITTHSPLFLLGLRDEESIKDFDLVEMPNGNITEVENFSEFKKAYDELNNSSQHEREINELVKQIKNDNTKIFTEGKTDVLHLERALKLFQKNGKYTDINFAFYDHSINKDPLGGSGNIRKLMKKLIDANLSTINIFIFDRDFSHINDYFGSKDPNQTFYCKNNVYAFKIPIPSFRKAAIGSFEKEISIEHYYPDDLIKRSVKYNKVDKHLFFAGDFDQNGTNRKFVLNPNGKHDSNSIRIISSDKYKVNKVGKSDGPNFALSKIEFFNDVVNTSDDYYESFSAIFDILEQIAIYS